MKVFIWTSVSVVSDNWHSGGGLVVFADDELRAREIANTTNGVHISEKELPDDVREVGDGSEAVYVMPNAGCC
jgi:hypothetical protein